MENESSDRARAKREYLVAGALAMVAAVLGVAFEPEDGGPGHRGELLVIAVLAATMYGRVAYGLMRKRTEDASDPSAERMRKMSVIWYLLAGVLGAAILRSPWAVFRAYGAEGLTPKEWVAALLGAAVVLGAAGRAIFAFLGERNASIRP